MTFNIDRELTLKQSQKRSSWSFGTPFKRSFMKARVISAPDAETVADLYDLYGDDAVQEFYDGLIAEYPGRTWTNADSTVERDISPYADEYLGAHRSHPEAVANARDFNGYIVQAGDAPGRELWGTSVYDPKRYDDRAYEKIAGDKMLANIFERLGINMDIDPRYILRLPDNDRHPMDLSNAEIGRKGADNGPEGERAMRDMLTTQWWNAYRSADPLSKALAAVLGAVALQDVGRASFYNPRSSWIQTGNELRYRSPAQVMMPSHGHSGSGFWEELIHGADDVMNTKTGYEGFGPVSAGHGDPKRSIGAALYDDFNDRFGGDLSEVTGKAEDAMARWRKNGPRYADDHEYIELLNHMYNLGSGGENAPGVLGKYANHRLHGSESENAQFKNGNYGTDTTQTEAFNSLLNGRMTGNTKGQQNVDRMFPNAKKRAEEMVGQMYEDKFHLTSPMKNRS